MTNKTLLYDLRSHVTSEQNKLDIENFRFKKINHTVGYPVYKCLACDIDVPIAYRNDHNSSAKHKTCVKIAEAVLQRLQRHLLVEDTNEIVEDSLHTYFCVSCAVVVKNTGKLQHEVSKDHQKSVLHDRYLNDLLNIYLNKEYIDTADIKYLKPHLEEVTKVSVINKMEERKQNAFETEDVTTNKPTCSHKVPINDTNDMSCESTSVHETKLLDKQRINHNNDLVSDGKDLGNAQNSLIDVDTHSISDQNITLEKHSFAEQDSNTGQSNLTDNKDVVDNNDLHSSIDELNHLVDDRSSIDAQYQSTHEQYHSNDSFNNIGKKLLQVDDQVHLTKEQSQSNDNSNNKIHKKQLVNDQDNAIEKQSPYDPNNIKNDDDDQNNDAKLNNVSVDYIMLVNSYEFHINLKLENEKSHVLNETDFEKYVDIITKLTKEVQPNHKLTFINEDYIEIQTLDNCIVTVKADNFNGFYSKDGQLQCRVCMLIVDEHPADHIYNVDHIAKIWLPLEDMHCFRKIDDSIKHCIHCNETFHDSYLHKMLDSHLIALEKAMGRSFPETPKKVVSKVGRIFCEPCNIYIDNHEINSHTNNKPHKIKLARFVKGKNERQTEIAKNMPGTSTDKSNSDSQHVKSDLVENKANNLNLNDNGEIYCEPCNLRIRKNKFPTHLNSKCHKTSLKSSKGILQKNYCETCNFYTENLSNHMTGGYHEYFKRNYDYQIKIKKETKVFCKVCTKKLSNDAKTISGHIKGRIHKSNYNTLLDVNLLKIVKDTFLCEVCKITVEPSEELQHIKSATHKKALVLFTTGKTYCCICKTYVLTVNRSVHLNSEFHKFYLESNKNNRNNNDGDPTALSLTSDIDTDYQINIKESIEAICRVCNCKIANETPNISKDIIMHKNGQRHNRYYNALLNEHIIKKVDSNLFCGACEITIEPTKELDHIDTKTHKCALAQADPISNTPFFQEHEKAFYRKAKALIENSLHNQYESTGNAVDIVPCRLCNINVSIENSKEHLDSQTHKLKYKNILHENRVRKVNNNYFCEICSVDVQDREELKHMRSLTHLFEKQLVVFSNSQLSSH